jgi:hypothetical protein
LDSKRSKINRESLQGGLDEMQELENDGKNRKNKGNNNKQVLIPIKLASKKEKMTLG